MLDEVPRGGAGAGPARARREPARRRGNATAGPQRQYLLCRSAGAERLAIPLAEVSRLEEIHASRVERMGPQEVIQHNEEIVPLVRLSRLLEESSARGRAPRRLGRIGASSIACSW
ncbi:chemotaxis protein CheW [Pseudenhygromyxa sp. WMMC2535]|nr:chemotaxis protein CheW [Pseudenhygromyxa sp. WMMC2535]